MRTPLVWLLFLTSAACGSSDPNADCAQGECGPGTSCGACDAPGPDSGSGDGRVDRVFVIMEENHPWTDFSTKPFVSSILPDAAHAENYTSPGTHPSLPNYIALEAGSNLGVEDDFDPAFHKLDTSAHLTRLMADADVSWTSWQESMPSGCPLDSSGDYAAKHNPMVYFTDSTGNLDPNDPYCIEHNRLLDVNDSEGEFATALADDTISEYNFITPNICNDAHDCSTSIADDWLSVTVPMIRDSVACGNHTCAIFIIADESAGGAGDDPVISVLVSPKAKTGYSNSIHYTHYSLLRTIEEIFELSPMLGAADSATDMSDLFTSFP